MDLIEGLSERVQVVGASGGVRRQREREDLIELSRRPRKELRGRTHSRARASQGNELVKNGPDPINRGPPGSGESSLRLGREARSISRIARGMSRLLARVKALVLAQVKGARIDEKRVASLVLLGEFGSQRPGDAECFVDAERAPLSAPCFDQSAKGRFGGLGHGCESETAEPGRRRRAEGSARFVTRCPSK